MTYYKKRYWFEECLQFRLFWKKIENGRKHTLYMRKYREIPEVREKIKQRASTPEAKLYHQRHHEKNKTNPHYIKKRKEYASTPKAKKSSYESKKRWRENPENREKQNKKAVEKKQIQKLKIYNHYSNYDIKCNCCGERHIEFLSIDHINNDGNKHRKKHGGVRFTGHMLCSWLIKNNYPPGFQILCFNCNYAKGIDPEHLCIHQKELVKKCQ